MSDPRVSNWGRVGRVCIWRYTSGRHAGGWHFVADAAGRDSLRKLFRLLATARWPGRAEMKVDRPGEEELRVPNFRGGVESPEVVHIRHA